MMHPFVQPSVGTDFLKTCKKWAREVGFEAPHCVSAGRHFSTVHTVCCWSRECCVRGWGCLGAGSGKRFTLSGPLRAQVWRLLTPLTVHLHHVPHASEASRSLTKRNDEPRVAVVVGLSDNVFPSPTPFFCLHSREEENRLRWQRNNNKNLKKPACSNH